MRIPAWLMWALAVVLTVGSVWTFLLGMGAAGGSFAAAAAGFAIFGLRMSGPKSHEAWSAELESSGRVIVFWKDGCPHSHSLLRSLDGVEGIAWVNIYRDPGAAHRLSELHRGMRLTPTAVAAGQKLYDPSPERIRELLELDDPQQSPHTPVA